MARMPILLVLITRRRKEGHSVQPWIHCQHATQHIQSQRWHVVEHVIWQCKLWLIVVSSLLPNCTDCLFCQSLQQLLATNQQAKATSQKASILMAEVMRQTTLTQCFNPPVAAAVPSTALDYRFLEVEGQHSSIY
jgi:hypothetical protein